MLFNKLLEIKTWKKDLSIKAVYVPNSTSSGEWTYFVYYYDKYKHTFYINDLKDWCNNSRASAINIIEHIVSKAYKQEMNSSDTAIQLLYIHKKPKVFCVYQQVLTKEIIIDKISFKVSKDENWKIIKFKSPSWNNPLEKTLSSLGIK